MAYNLIIAYDLIKPGQNYETVRAKIKSLGRWHQPQYSLFYVHTDKTPQQASAAIVSIMDAKDKLAVIDAKLVILHPAVAADIAAINKVWFTQAA